MNEQELACLLDTLRSRHATGSQRAKAARSLAEWDTPEVFSALLDVAQQEDADAKVARAAGESIARMLVRRGRVDQVPLAEFSGDAYLGYDETIARHLRARVTTTS